MASTISLKADRSSIKKGESVNVSWSSSIPESLALVIDDGDSVQRIQVPDTGSRICWSNRATKDISFTLVAVVNGRKQTESITVKVKGKGRKPATEAGIGKFQIWKEKMQARLSVFMAQLRCAWASMKAWQRILWVLLLALPLVMIIIGTVK